MSRELNKNLSSIFAEFTGILVARIRENLVKVIIVVFLIYGLTIFFLGISAGVFITDSYSNLYFLNEFTGWVTGVENLTKSDNPYDISFFASAEQDFWFFLVIGLVISIPTIRHPKSDGLSTKILHFFPKLREQHPYMGTLIEMINKASCITKKYEREMTILKIEDNFMHVLIKTKLIMKNLHHNFPLDHNMGNFKITPDKSVLDKFKQWGELHSFKSSEDLVIVPPTILEGESFQVKDYNIKLDADQEMSYECSIKLIVDPKIPCDISFIRFTEKAKLKFLNTCDTPVTITINKICNNTEIPIPLGQQKKLSLLLEKDNNEEIEDELSNFNQSDKISIIFELNNQLTS